MLSTCCLTAVRSPMNYKIAPHGFTIVTAVLDAEGREEILALLGAVTGAGRRGILSIPAIAKRARSSRVLDLARPYLSAEPLPVRAIYFDKSPEANWLVAWHQDLTLAVRRRIDVPGFGPWSVKDGVTHVQPPVEYLEQMLTIRLHLDDANDSNGALRVLPGTHCLGRLSAERIQQWRAARSEVVCAAAAGDALLMRPLLLHASRRSTANRRRRVLHIEYAGFALPGGLQWHDLA